MKKFIYTLILSLLAINVFGVTRTYTGTGVWNSASNWGGTLPSSTDDVIIDGDVTLDGTVTINNITINASRNFNCGTQTINITGNFSNSGTFTANTGTVIFNGATIQTITGATTFNHLIIDQAVATNSVSFSNNCTINGDLTITRGILDINSSSITINGVTLIDSQGTFQDDIGIITDINTFGVLNINNGGKLIALNTGNKQFRFRGNIVNNGTFDLDNTGNSSSGWQLGNASTPITVTNESNSTMFFSKFVNGSGVIVGDVTIANPTNTSAGNIELRGNGTPSGTGNIRIDAGKTLTNNLGDRNVPSGKRLIASPRNSGGIGATFINNGLVEIGGGAGTTEPAYDFFTNPNSSVISRTNATISTTYNDLILTGSPVPAHTLSGTITINQNLKILAANTVNTSNHTINIGGNFENSGTLNGSGTIVFNGLIPQFIIGSTTFHNLTIDQAAGQTVTINNNISVANTLNLIEGFLLANFHEIQLTGTNFNMQLTGGSSSSFIVLGASGSNFSKLSRTNANITGVALFPIGAVVGDYTPLSVTSPGSYGTIAVYLRDEGVTTSATTPPLLTPKVNRIWSLVTTSPVGADIEIKWNASNELPSTLPSTTLLQQYASPIPSWITPVSNTFDGVNRTVTGTISPGGTGINSDFAIFNPVIPTIVLAPANSNLPNGVVNTSYTFPISASGGTSPYTFNITSGALPPGMTFSSTGSLSGFPSVTGTFNFTVTATDALSYTGSQNYTLTIVPDIQFVTPSSFNFTANTNNSFTLSALTSANLPVSFFSTNTNVATINNGNILTIQENVSGETEIKAFNLGDANFLPSDTVTVMKISQFGIINAFENDLDKQFLVYPNPSIDYIWVQNMVNPKEVKEIILLNSLGQSIDVKVSMLNNLWKIDISNTPKGIYFIKVITNKGIFQRKIIKN
ncbi:MAG: putative Ig domain-containing protein [Raineya sp.]|nr:putative Ig domain-containing protein [Raineya sp.]